MFHLLSVNYGLGLMSIKNRWLFKNKLHPSAYLYSWEGYAKRRHLPLRLQILPSYKSSWLVGILVWGLEVSSCICLHCICSALSISSMRITFFISKQHLHYCRMFFAAPSPPLQFLASLLTPWPGSRRKERMSDLGFLCVWLCTLLICGLLWSVEGFRVL